MAEHGKQSRVWFGTPHKYSKPIGQFFSNEIVLQVVYKSNETRDIN